MRTPDHYREFAAECYRLAADAKNEMHATILREMARAFGELAEELEGKSSCRSAQAFTALAGRQKSTSGQHQPN